MQCCCHLIGVMAIDRRWSPSKLWGAHRSYKYLCGSMKRPATPVNTGKPAAMNLAWRSAALIVALLFGDAFAIALGGQKFTVTPDKRQAQDLVRLAALHTQPHSSNIFSGDMGRALLVRTRRAYLPLHRRIPSMAASGGRPLERCSTKD